MISTNKELGFLFGNNSKKNQTLFPSPCHQFHDGSSTQEDYE